jgi:polyphosphate kinase 2 (PPK2 family)
VRFAQLYDDDAAMHRLTDVDLTLSLSKKEEKARLKECGKTLQRLRLTAAGLLGDGRLGRPVCVVFEGWDASGKGGAIRRLIAPFDIRHVRVASFAAPSEDEKRHYFTHRFEAAMPGWGGMSIYDRSWYGRVLVERVEGFASEEEWRRAYDEINAFEHLLAAEGMVFVKLWMQISDAEQLRRFKRREGRDLKEWKLTDEDWRNREKRGAYEEAVAEMLERTSTEWAPWIVVPAEDKRYARVFVMDRVIEAYERAVAK